MATTGAVLAVLFALAVGACADHDAGGPAPPLGTSRSALSSTSLPAPSTVSGYACDKPWCADISRACDDIIRSGCGPSYVEDAAAQLAASGTSSHGKTQPGGGQGSGVDHLSAPQPGSALFIASVRSCVAAAWEALREGIVTDSLREQTALTTDALRQLERREMSLLGAALADCTRQAKTCAERLQCSQGFFQAPDFIADPHLPPAPPPPPPTPPAWNGQNQQRNPTLLAPWPNGRVVLVPGVDSPSCARCAIERCPAISFLCFGAEGDASACPNGDCCASLRTCIRECGGYAQGQRGTDAFGVCLAGCQKTRPNALAQLADLQRCAKNECAGCEKFDSKDPPPPGVSP